MAGVNTYSLPRFGAARILLITADRQLAAHLRTEFKLALADLTWKAQPPAPGTLGPERYQLVVLDGAALAAAPPSWLAELRTRLPAARFFLLVDPQAAAAKQPTGLDGVYPRPRTDQEAQALVAATLGRKAE
ncbi:MAG: hypothetical protein ACE5HB_10565, partial [Terriglobia bacterium]